MKKTGFFTKVLLFLFTVTLLLLVFCFIENIPVFTRERGEEITGEIAERYTEIEEKANSLVPPIILSFLEKIKKLIEK